MLAIALAVLGIVLGGAGLYFGMTANQRIAPISESVTAGSSTAAQLEKDISALSTQIVETAAKLDGLDGSFRRQKIYSTQSEAAVKKLGSEVAANRQQVNDLAGKLEELAQKGIRVASGPAPVATGSSTSTVEAAPVAASGSASTYRIQSGDTFAKIASQQGVSLQALLDANPDADPRRLRIGQEIQIPSN